MDPRSKIVDLRTKILAGVTAICLAGGAFVVGDNAGAAVDPGTGEVVGEFTYGLTPARLLDSRPRGTTTDGQFSGTGKLAPNTALTLKVTGRGGVPAGATSAILNVTVVGPTTGGYVAVWPSGNWPGNSNANFSAGSIVSNLVFSGLDSQGRVKIMANAGSPDIVVDVVGYLSDQPAR